MRRLALVRGLEPNPSAVPALPEREPEISLVAIHPPVYAGELG